MKQPSQRYRWSTSRPTMIPTDWNSYWWAILYPTPTGMMIEWDFDWNSSPPTSPITPSHVAPLIASPDRKRYASWSHLPPRRGLGYLLSERSTYWGSNRWSTVVILMVSNTWNRFNISKPNKKSILSPSRIVSEHGMNYIHDTYLYYTLSMIWISIMWIRPMIFYVPTPTAIPAYLLSTKRIIPHRSAHERDIIVLWAPLSTKAYTGTFTTVISIYSIVIYPKFSGRCSYANSLFEIYMT